MSKYKRKHSASRSKRNKNKARHRASIKENNIKKEELKHKENKKKKFDIILIVRIIFIGIIIFALINIIKWYIDTSKAKEEFVELKEQVFLKEENSDNKEERIDFEKLKQINSDVVGWIKINNTCIDYPIVQAKDNDYYLRRNINKKYSISGSIFMDYRNNNFEDKNTIIYGHNMKDDTMFSDLKKIYEGKLEDNTVSIYQEDGIKKYKIFATYIIDPDKNIKVTMTEKEYKQYLQEAVKKSSIDFNVDVSANDKIITLLTCSYKRTQRMIAQAVLIEE